MKANKTSWGKVATWYEKTVTNDNSYQNTVIKPNLIRLLNLKAGQSLLDVASGSGFFAREFSKLGAKVTGIDIGSQLIKIAKQQDPKSTYLVANAEKMDAIKSEAFDVLTIVLALQNIKNFQSAISEISRVLKPGGRCLIVLNHPAFRLPGKSFWQYDEQQGVQYRRLDGYLSEYSKAMDMHPGQKKSETTYSFHRPLQVYFKAFVKNHLVVVNLEEWISPKESDKGKRKLAEDKARKEFPLFMCLELKKM